MSGFSAQWLALREPADVDARSSALAKFVARSGQILDLGAGTGSNFRYLSSRFPLPQHWTLVDHDPALLARAPAGVDTHHADLNEAVNDDDLFRGCSVVTASALLDLVSERWMGRLVRQCRSVEAAVLFALSYDGRIECTPAEPEDDDVRRLVNEHQRGDKGFGPALGPDATSAVVAMLTDAGYTVNQAQSDWKLTPDMRALQAELIAGWANVAQEIAPDKAAIIDDWQTRRRAHVRAGRSRIVVGHLDVAGICRA